MFTYGKKIWNRRNKENRNKIRGTKISETIVDKVKKKLSHKSICKGIEGIVFNKRLKSW